MLTQSANNMFVYCQNQKFGCDWQGLYGDARKHLAEFCSACKPEQLLTRLEDSEVQNLKLKARLDAANLAIDKLKEENAKMKEEVGAATKQARDRLVEKYVREAELAVMKGDLDARTSLVRDLEAHVAALKENGSHMVIDLKKLEDENSFLRERNRAQLRDRNRLIWNLQEKLRAMRKRGRRDDSSRRGGSPKRRRRHSSIAHGSKQPPSRAVVDLEDERPAPWRCNDGFSPLVRWTTAKGQF